MLGTFVECLNSLEDSAAFETAMASLVDELGFDHFAYAALGFEAGRRRKNIVVNYPLAWVSYYIDQDYLSYDPVIKRASDSFGPFLWCDIQRSDNLTPKQRRVLNEGSDFGLKHGATVPLHLPGGAMALLSVTSRESEKIFRDLWREHALSLQTATLYYHSAMENNLEQSKGFQGDRLTAGEREVLLWTARNKSISQISDMTVFSVNEVRRHLSSAMDKLRTRTKQHAVIKAITSGVISP